VNITTPRVVVRGEDRNTTVLNGDGLADHVGIEGTDGVDTTTVSALDGVATVVGLAAEVAVLHPEVAFDRLDITTLGGDDAVDNQLPAGVTQLYVDGKPQ
jgi:hypothetical protein